MSLTGNTTYSFEDVTGAFAHPLVGVFTFDGKGVGELTIEMDNDMTVHDRAADGTIMVSKLKGEPGKLTINVQQTSAIHKFLVNAYQAVKLGDSSYWASGGCTIRCVADGSNHVMTGMSFQKVPSKTYKAEGSRVVWTLLCADIQNLATG